MEIRTSEESKEHIENFSKRYINLLHQKKEIDEDIKALKEEFKEEGVPVGIVTKVINRIKADKKKTDSEKFEEETIKEWLEANAEVDDGLGSLVAK